MSLNYSDVLNFFKGKSVLVTGNTGFKGAWLTYILLSAGAKVIGYALPPTTALNLFGIIGLENSQSLTQYYSDVRNLDALKKVIDTCKPEIVFHLAAQPLVRESYRDPVGTYSTNIMGTVNICECLRLTSSVRSFINITTDKVYKNKEWYWGYRENDELDGLDPYSNSKSCSELITHSYKDSFFQNRNIGISTSRAGNVIGGGDFSADRIIPDCIKTILGAYKDGRTSAVIDVRNPYSTRPYEHVLEPLFSYMLIAKKQYEDIKFSGYYNVGPDDCSCVNTGELVSLFCSNWNSKDDRVYASWQNKSEKDPPHEADFLKLDCSKIKSVFEWKPRWTIEEAIKQTINWTRIWLESMDMEEGKRIRSIREEMGRECKIFIENE